MKKRLRVGARGPFFLLLTATITFLISMHDGGSFQIHNGKGLSEENVKDCEGELVIEKLQNVNEGSCKRD